MEFEVLERVNDKMMIKSDEHKFLVRSLVCFEF